MTQHDADDDPRGVLAEIRAAINGRDLEALVACFTSDVESQTPAHPERSFRGSDQVRRNWGRILAGAPDLHAELVRSAREGATAWAEWSWSGTRRDGVPVALRGVTIQEVRAGRAALVSFYMEPLVETAGGPDAAVRQAFGEGADH